MLLCNLLTRWTQLVRHRVKVARFSCQRRLSFIFFAVQLSGSTRIPLSLELVEVLRGNQTLNLLNLQSVGRDSAAWILICRCPWFLFNFFCLGLYQRGALRLAWQD